ncbi:hypothetical protein ACFQ6H_03235 [Rhodococcus sp. NPDC056506]|uniref:hypothetical protein n=1 Tax=Rhodococcus sp. NPDC056506 TaxID=3345844 RepID=UPI0036704090
MIDGTVPRQVGKDPTLYSPESIQGHRTGTVDSGHAVFHVVTVVPPPPAVPFRFAPCGPMPAGTARHRCFTPSGLDPSIERPAA